MAARIGQYRARPRDVFIDLPHGGKRRFVGKHRRLSVHATTRLRTSRRLRDAKDNIIDVFRKRMLEPQLCRRAGAVVAIA
jgi:hypothetical protein